MSGNSGKISGNFRESSGNFREYPGIHGRIPGIDRGLEDSHADDRDCDYRHRWHSRMDASDDHNYYDFDDDSGDDHDDKDNNHHEEFDDDHAHKQHDERKVLRNIRVNRSHARPNQTTTMVTTLVNARIRFRKFTQNFAVPTTENDGLHSHRFPELFNSGNVPESSGNNSGKFQGIPGKVSGNSGNGFRA